MAAFSDWIIPILPAKAALFQQLPFSAKAYLLAQTKETLLVLTPAGREELLAQEIALFSSIEVIVVPAEEEEDPDSLGRRLEAIARLPEARDPFIVIASVQSAFGQAPSLDELVQTTLSVKVGQPISLSSVQKTLDTLGYILTDIVTEKQEMALRGGILDVFPINASCPVRIEWWDNAIASIRTFDPGNQKSIEKRKDCTLVGRKERCLGKLTDLFSARTVFDDLVTLEDHAVQFFGSTAALQPLLPRAMFFTEQPLSQIGESYTKGGQAHFSWIGETILAENQPITFFPVSDLESLLEEKITCLFAVSNASDQALIQTRIPHAQFFPGRLETGFYDPAAHRALIPSHFTTHRKFLARRENRFIHAAPASDLLHLEPGDLVVHLQHGIGKYRGVETRPNHLGIPAEFFCLEYAGKATCFVPIDRAFELTRYVGSDDASATALHELGTSKWARQKGKSLAAIDIYAKQLVDAAAARQAAAKQSCDADSDLLQRFEADFPYTITEDQQHAIEAIKADLQRPTCMDRLLAGDVGYGKTEVAMRAAFKMVVDGGKQVAVLSPTTILTLQHFETFSARMAGFPIRIAQISRFVKGTPQILADLAEGKIDILLGTHRLLSEDVRFSNLGLLIIDEEQRFGVKAKEKLRLLKADMDCLSLSATPIPRTLYLSLAGARELSTINSPPHDRLPINSRVEEDDDELVRLALLRELGRGGQVFFIHNRIETVPQAKARIENLVPSAQALIAHGQMDNETIDEVFHAFKQGKGNVLLATTIVENGIDIPNANTILIDRADRFGLSELHQLRGRVGRWNKKAWCYFLIPKQQALTELAYQRLEAIAQATGLGAGLKIAMRDLEIRGAGNLVGTEQSGHLATIGFHLYCKMLKKAVDRLRGHSMRELPDTRLDLKIDARLPSSYIDSQTLRLELYQRAGLASSLEETEALFAEIEDRFGKLPEEGLWLKTLTALRIQAAQAGITLIRQSSHSLLIESERPDGKTSRTVLFKAPRKLEEFTVALLRLIND